MSYWFTFVKTGRRKPFHQIRIGSKTMQQISLKLRHLDHGVYGEHGAESIHKIFRLLQRTYCSMQPATRSLQSMLRENYRLVHPDAKALKPVILKRKQHPKGEKSVLP